MAELRMAPRAHDELVKALEWYARESPRALSTFATAVDEALDALESNPERFPALNERYRYARVFGFPYYIAFRMAGENPLIVAIRHTSRDDLPFEQ